MHSQCPHPITSPVVRNISHLANRDNPQMHGPWATAQLPSAKRRLSVPVGERESSQRGSSIPSTIQDQNSTPSSSLNDSRIADITFHVNSTPSTTQRCSIITPTATPGTRSRNSPAHSGTVQADATCRVVSSPASGIASTPTSLRGHENLPTIISNPEAPAIITNPLRSRPTESNHR
jgi:hypothetical protein